MLCDSSTTFALQGIDGQLESGTVVTCRQNTVYRDGVLQANTTTIYEGVPFAIFGEFGTFTIQAQRVGATSGSTLGTVTITVTGSCSSSTPGSVRVQTTGNLYVSQADTCQACYTLLYSPVGRPSYSSWSTCVGEGCQSVMQVALAPSTNRRPTVPIPVSLDLLSFSIRGIQQGFQLPWGTVVKCEQTYRDTPSTTITAQEFEPYSVPGNYAYLTFYAIPPSVSGYAFAPSSTRPVIPSTLGTVRIWRDTAGTVSATSTGNLYINQASAGGPDPMYQTSVEVLYSKTGTPFGWSQCVGSPCRPLSSTSLVATGTRPLLRYNVSSNITLIPYSNVENVIGWNVGMQRVFDINNSQASNIIYSGSDYSGSAGTGYQQVAFFDASALASFATLPPFATNTGMFQGQYAGLYRGMVTILSEGDSASSWVPTVLTAPSQRGQIYVYRSDNFTYVLTFNSGAKPPANFSNCVLGNPGYCFPTPTPALPITLPLYPDM